MQRIRHMQRFPHSKQEEDGPVLRPRVPTGGIDFTEPSPRCWVRKQDSSRVWNLHQDKGCPPGSPKGSLCGIRKKIKLYQEAAFPQLSSSLCVCLKSIAPFLPKSPKVRKVFWPILQISLVTAMCSTASSFGAGIVVKKWTIGRQSDQSRWLLISVRPSRWETMPAC